MKLLIPILMLLIIAAIWLFLPGDAEELALAEQVAVPVTVEQAAFMEKVLKALLMGEDKLWESISEPTASAGKPTSI